MGKLLSVFMKRFGWFGFVRLLFYPLTALLTTPLRLAQTLWNCRILTKGGWEDYSHFNAYTGMDYLVYWTIAFNLHKFGRSGNSPYMGIGKHPLRRFLQHSLISLYPYWKAGTIVLLLGMFGWFFAHLMWLNYVSVSWVLLVMFLALISTTFYANTFALQNYNVLGWFFFPLGLYGIVTKNWIITAIAWFLVSFGSFTVTFIAGILSVVSAVMNLSFVPIFAFIPAGLKLLTHLYPFLNAKDIKSSFLIMMKALGMCNKGTVYKVVPTPKSIFTAIYFMLIYGQFFIVCYLISGKVPAMFLAGLIIFMLNSSLIMRFLDIQSVYMLMLSLATVEVLQAPDFRILLSYWFLISPLPLLIPFPFMKKVLDAVPVLAPFSIKKLKEDMEFFLEPVKPSEKVIIAFDNPKGVPEKFLDGYRPLFALPHYIASEKAFHVMPDCWAVFESNYKGAPNFWGRDTDSVLKNIKFWNADYAIVYQDAGTQLNPTWESAGFKILSKFSWANYEKELRGVKPFNGETPDWWLLKKS